MQKNYIFAIFKQNFFFLAVSVCMHVCKAFHLHLLHATMETSIFINSTHMCVCVCMYVFICINFLTINENLRAPTSG